MKVDDDEPYYYGLSKELGTNALVVDNNGIVGLFGDRMYEYLCAGKNIEVTIYNTVQNGFEVEKGTQYCYTLKSENFLNACEEIGFLTDVD